MLNVSTGQLSEKPLQSQDSLLQNMMSVYKMSWCIFLGIYYSLAPHTNEYFVDSWCSG